jgi:parvulin-like peptidyl-prolyl isomerase
MDIEEKEESPQQKKIKVGTAIYAILIILAGYVILAGIIIYFFGANNTLIKKTAQILPYPVAIVGDSIITVDKLGKNLDSAKRFYESQDFSDMGVRIDFTTEDGKKRLEIKKKYILNKMIEDKVIETEAIKRGIRITPEIISQEVDRQMKEYNSESYVKENLAKLYGWNIEDFKENIVKPDMYREKLFEKIKEEDPSFKEAKDKISKADEELKKTKNFETIVQKYSEGESVKNGGGLGWFSSDQMLPELANVVFFLEKGKTSGIIESSLGYHIVNLEDKKTEDGVDKVNLKQIFVRTKPFGEWIADKEKSSKAYIMLREFYWDKELGQVEFRGEDLKKFEENLRINFPEDISVMF